CGADDHRRRVFRGAGGMSERFTLVFEGDLRAHPDNPHKTETPFGFPVAAGIGDAFAEFDALEASHAQLIEALEQAQTVCADNLARTRETCRHDLALKFVSEVVSRALTQARERDQ